ncbi:hypothetical protein [Frankia sp. QA3]|uniref:hypothetical protein n=1 Tax=Frankia sp. QA3 TaxID=710111 RepID=UPI000269CED9|nr:hypothetical protein [Frankia sp. QA3]EIV96250.1 hypothetical protein FraQA3DRAFT_6124 [Frankia sp. QA3]
MPVVSDARPTFGRLDVDAVVVTTASLPNQNAENVAETVVARWNTSDWPRELLSLSCFVSGDGTSVLTYAQWAAENALVESLRDAAGVSWAGVSWAGVSRASVSRALPGRVDGDASGVDASGVEASGVEASGVEITGPTPFRIYRTVRGSAVTDEDPLPESFPVAFFTMPDHETATRWVDGLLSAEEESEGDERAYPGAIAANFHVSIDGTRVLVLSEWLSDEAASAHIAAVWEPILERFGGDAGALYRHYATLTGPGQSGR